MKCYLLLMILLVFLPSWQGAVRMHTETRYFTTISSFRIGDDTVYSLALSPSQSNEKAEWSKMVSGNVIVKYGIKVYKLSGAVLTELTTGEPVAVVTRDADGEGLQSATWDAPNVQLDPSDDIVVVAYRKFGDENWETRIVIIGMFPMRMNLMNFITNVFCAKKLKASTWTIWYYTLRLYREPPADDTAGAFCFGKDSHNSRIENFKWLGVPWAGRLREGINTLTGELKEK